MRLFDEFPRGRSGAGLLLLRAAVGMLLLSQAVSDFTAGRDGPAAAWILGGLALVAGALLLVGFMTPIAAALGALALTAAWALSPSPRLSLQEVLPVVLAVVIALLGPGVFSIDARLFGLREIIIPRSDAGASSPANDRHYQA